MSSERIEITCFEQWMPHQIWINFSASNPEIHSTYTPYFVGGRYNATLALYRIDGKKPTKRERDRIIKLARQQYPDGIHPD